MSRYRRVKQILAIIGLVIIAGLYIVTLVLALIGNEQTRSLFLASIICTVLVPALLYIFAWMYRLVKGSAEEAREKNNAGPSDDPSDRQ